MEGMRTYKEAALNDALALAADDYYSATRHGQQLIKRGNLDKVIHALQQRLLNQDHVNASTAAKTLIDLAIVMDTAKEDDRNLYGSAKVGMVQVVSVIALKCVVDTFGGATEQGWPAAAGIAQRIGDYVEKQFQAAKAAHRLGKEAWAKAEANWTKPNQTPYYVEYNLKRQIVQALEAGEYQSIQWDASTRARVGAYLLDVIVESTDLLIHSKRIDKKATKQQTIIRPNPEALKGMVKTLEDIGVQRVVGYPMIEKPISWEYQDRPGVENTSGGFYLDELKHLYPQVRSRFNTTRTQLSADGVKALNRLGETALRPDVEMIDAYLWAVDTKQADIAGVNMPPAVSSYELRDMSRSENHYPGDFEADSAEGNTAGKKRISDWKYERKQQIDATITAEKKAIRTLTSRDAAAAIRNRGEVYFSWSCDYRGRMYTQQMLLQPQGSKAEKVLLKLATPVQLTEAGIREVYTALGVAFQGNKISLRERLQWGLENIDRLLGELTGDPSDILTIYRMGADEPWDALSLVNAYRRYRATGLWDVMVGADASQSGFQILGGLLRDPSALLATNVLTNDLEDHGPVDGYSYVKREALRLIRGEVAEQQAWVDQHPIHSSIKTIIEEQILSAKIARTLCKRVAVPLVYGSTHTSTSDTIWAELNEAGLNPFVKFKHGDWIGYDDKTPAELAGELNQALTHYLRKAVALVFPKPVETLSWLRELARKSLQQQRMAGIAKPSLKWTLSDGTVIDYWDTKPKTLEVKTLEVGKLKIAVDQGDVVNSKTTCDAFAPGYVHSLDALLLREVLKDWDHDIITIHDCVKADPNHMGELKEKIKSAFITICEGNSLVKLANEMKVDMPKVEPGDPDLDLQMVKNSRYIFH